MSGSSKRARSGLKGMCPRYALMSGSSKRARSGLKVDVSEVRTDVRQLQDGQKRLEDGQKRLEDDVKSLRGSALEQRLSTKLLPLVGREFNVRRVFAIWSPGVIDVSGSTKEFHDRVQQALEDGIIRR